jgi:hypothetical protein
MKKQINDAGSIAICFCLVVVAQRWRQLIVEEVADAADDSAIAT